MAIQDSHFRLGVVLGAIILVAAIGGARFCGSVSLPAKPDAPPTTSGTSKQLLSRSAATAGVYENLLAKDAVAAGVRAPSIEEMSRKFAYRVDEGRQVLEVGEPAKPVAGLELRALHSDDSLVLEIKNTTGATLAYNITAQPTPNIACNAARPLPLNALTIAPNETLIRTECVWRNGMALAISKVETIELPPLGVHYLHQVPPAQVGLPASVARGHQATRSRDACSSIHSNVVRTGLENGEIGWRDLVDFYARHRCQTYQFPHEYRALTRDGQITLPADGTGK
ncbi:MAG: hypothetical protein H0T79_16885 [Deltaproteobacteria bacterium]|nr:hypothetical protein [Deltaproteobacteria bacterium]